MTTWLLSFYVLVLIASGIGASVLDIRDREPWWYTGLGIISALTGVLLCLSFGFPKLKLAAQLGVLLPCAIVFDLGWTCVTVPMEAKEEFPDSKRLMLITIVVALLLYVPAWILGIAAYMRTFQPSA